MKRSRRRHDLERMKKRARLIAKKLHLPWDAAEKREAHEKAWERLADHLQSCSCWMCGNQRKWHGPRPQEARALHYWHNDLRDAGLQP